MRWLLILMLLTAPLSGAEVAQQQREHTLVRVTLDADEVIAGVLTKDFEVIAHAPTTGGAVWTAPPGRYVVIVSGSENRMQILPVTILGDAPVPPSPVPPGPEPPGPTPPPEPLDGVGSRVYPIIKAVGDKASCIGLAANFRSVLDDMNSGRIVSAQVARTQLVAVNNGLRLKTTWRPAIDAMLSELSSVRTLEECQKVFRGIIAALELASK